MAPPFDPFDAVGAGVGAAPTASVAPSPGSVARAGGPVINLPQVAGSVPLGNGDYALGQGAPPAVIDVAASQKPGGQPWLPVGQTGFEASLAPDGSGVVRRVGDKGSGVPAASVPQFAQQAVAAAPAATQAGAAATAPAGPPAAKPAAGAAAAGPARPYDPFDAIGAGVGPAPAAAPAAALLAAPVAPAAASTVPPGKQSGYVANIGAGTSRAVAGLLGLPIDLINGLTGLDARLNKAIGISDVPPMSLPGGAGDWQKAFGLVGANPENVVPATPGEALAGAVSQGVTGMLLPGGLARMATREAVGAVNPALQALAQGAGPGGAFAGALGGATGFAAAQAVPPEYAPLADVFGNIVGGGLGAITAGGLTAAGRVGARAYDSMPFGRQSELIDPATGAPFPGQPEGGTTAGQQGLARDQIVAASGQQPADLVRSIDAAIAAQPLPGSQPSMGQGTGNLGLLRLERRQRTLNPQPFTEAEARRSVAQVNALRGMAGPEEAGRAAGEFVARQLASLRAANDAIDAAEADTARRVTEQLGGNPAEPGVDHQTLGGAHRDALEALRIPVKRQFQRINDALDPEGKWALDVSGVRDAARQLLAEINPRMGDELGPEAGVLNVAANLRDVELFRDLMKLDSNLGAVQRSIRNDIKLGAESPPMRRVTILRDAVDAAMAEAAKAEAIKAWHGSGAEFTRFDPAFKVADGYGESASKLLLGQGVKGIKFLDGLSRGRWGRARTITEQIAELEEAKRENPPAHPSKGRYDHDIAVLKKQLEDQDAGNLTHNYVVFDPADIQIARRNGAVPTVAPKPGVGDRLASAAEGTPAAGTSVFTPSGREVGVRYRVAEGDSLITSHRDDMTVNPEFPPELQPRDRGRTASQRQVNDIASDLRPPLLGASADVNTGAPIIGPDGIVESGNGRVLGIKRAYGRNNSGSQRYRAWLEGQGYDTTGMKNPILVRERTSDLSPADRAAFTREAAAPTGLSMSATEQAAVDAGRISPDMLGLVQPGDINSTANRPFVRKFINDALETTEHGEFFTEQNGLSVAGQARLRAALLQRAYGNPDLVAALAEVGDENIKALGGALQDAAGGFARLRAGIEDGTVDPKVDITPDILEAVRLVQQARTARIPLKDAVAQQELGGAARPALTEALLRAAYGDNLAGRASQARMAEYLSYFAEEAEKQGTQARLFGANQTPAEIWQGVQARGTGTAGSGGVGGGTGAGAAGNEARGPGAGAAGAGDAAAAEAPAEKGAQPAITEPILQPNMPPEGRQELRARNRFYAIYKDTFRRGSVGTVLQSGQGPGGFNLAESSVPATLFKGGPGGAEAADGLIRAAGSPEAAVALLGDYPAFAFRRAAEVDGIIDPGKAAKWIKDNSAALGKLPGLREKFADAAAAGQAVAEASARGKAAIEAFENSALSHYITKAGEVVEPEKAMGSLLGSPTAPADARALVAAMKGDKAATAGLRRNFADYLLQKFSSTKEAGTTGEHELKAATVQGFLADPSKMQVARTILGPDGATLLKKIGADIEMVKRGITATGIPGSPGSASDFLAAFGHAGHGTSFFGQLLGAELIGQMIADTAQSSTVAGMAGGTALAAASVVMNAARLAGVKRVNELATAALLDPGRLGRALLVQGDMATKPAILRTLLARIGSIGVGSAAVGKDNMPPADIKQGAGR